MRDALVVWASKKGTWQLSKMGLCTSLRSCVFQRGEVQVHQLQQGLAHMHQRQDARLGQTSLAPAQCIIPRLSTTRHAPPNRLPLG